jgi:3-oxoacyl-[acyl-carrier-protein] synthase II
VAPHRSGPAAVVGAGVRTPAGNTVDELWATLCAASATAELFEDDRLPAGAAALACRVREFDPASVLTPVEARRLDRSHAFAFAAAQDALNECGDLPPPERRAVVCGVGLPAATTYEQQWTHLMTGGVRAVTPLLIPLVMPSTIASHLSIRFDLQGPCLTVSAACASGAAAIAEGVELLRRGAADLVLAGGVDSLVTYGPMCGFIRLDAMSRNVEQPGLASRPFDIDRDGFVMGEGAGFVVLTRPADAGAAGGLGLVLGHASTADAHHLVAPAPDGRGALRCMSLALADAGVHAEDVTHVNAHGTSTVLNDLAEARALATLLGGHASPVTAVKGSTGHMIGASGAVEAIVALAAIRHGQVPPVAGLRTVDPACSVDVVHDRPRDVPPGPVLSNSFGFGGTNTVLVLGPVG